MDILETRSALPPGPGFGHARQRLGYLLIATSLTLSALVGYRLTHRERAAATIAPCERGCPRAARAAAPPKATWADRQRLQLRVAEAEEAVARGAGCRLGLLRLKLELNAVESELADCGRWKAELAEERALLLQARANLLSRMHGSAE